MPVRERDGSFFLLVASLPKGCGCAEDIAQLHNCMVTLIVLEELHYLPTALEDVQQQLLAHAQVWHVHVDSGAITDARQVGVDGPSLRATSGQAVGCIPGQPAMHTCVC